VGLCKHPHKPLYAVVCDHRGCDKDVELGEHKDFSAAQQEAARRGWGTGMIDLSGLGFLEGHFCPDHLPRQEGSPL